VRIRTFKKKTTKKEKRDDEKQSERKRVKEWGKGKSRRWIRGRRWRERANRGWISCKKIMPFLCRLQVCSHIISEQGPVCQFPLCSFHGIQIKN
jgi:hypothetical protein